MAVDLTVSDEKHSEDCCLHMKTSSAEHFEWLWHLADTRCIMVLLTKGGGCQRSGDRCNHRLAEEIGAWDAAMEQNKGMCW